MTTCNQILDARGLSCPLPILRTRNALNGMNSGENLEVLATDPGAMKDMDAFCKQTGNSLMSVREEGTDQIFVIRKM